VSRTYPINCHISSIQLATDPAAFGGSGDTSIVIWYEVDGERRGFTTSTAGGKLPLEVVLDSMLTRLEKDLAFKRGAK
jgi:hypothetical protein